MDTLIGKLTNLAYEFFGVLLPGLMFLLLVSLWYLALGPAIEVLTLGVLPSLTLADVAGFESGLSSSQRLESAVLLLLVIYVFGHFANWFAGGRESNVKTSRMPYTQRLHMFLTFRVPVPTEHYATELETLFQAVGEELSLDLEKTGWRGFYPVAKSILGREGGYSLLPTYQHKYTLHRSIAWAGALVFWLALVSLIGAVVAVFFGARSVPHWQALVALLVGSLMLVVSFSGSYLRFWRLWGDTVVTESYGLICGAEVDENGTSD